MNIVLTLVFSIVMLFFMIFPAMKITEWIDGRYAISKKFYTPVMLTIVVLLSVTVGIFLRFA
jgi:uncharacterized membrane protein YidH (DUF202 family)